MSSNGLRARRAGGGKAALPPGPRMPGTLQTLGWVLRPLPFMEQCRRRYGDVFTVRIRNENTWVFLSDPEDVKRVFTGDPELLRAGEANGVLRPVVGPSSVLLLDGAEHMTHRKLMLPPFHGERMQRYGELMVEITRESVAAWPLGEPFALWPRMQSITLDVIMRAVFGITEQHRSEHVRGLLKHMLDWTTDVRQLAYIALMGPARTERNPRFRKVMDPVDDAVLAEIRRRRAEPDLAEREDILSMLVQARYEDGEPMSDQELRDELITLLVAGHETTATSLAWAFERLLRHGDKLERLRQEVLAGESDAYLDAVVKETLRLRPVIPIVVRKLVESMELGGRVIPAGATVAPCIHLVHRREDVYPQPNAFRPERFLEQPAGTYTWIPFGGGVRRCLGASFAQFEMKKVLETVIAQVQLRAVDACPERIVRRAITLTPERRAEAIVVARNDAPARDSHVSAAPVPIPA
ncbi:MAG TPA: cytochrome P450 [Solirubrobacteraceae bacterium]|nr:cytochrome P450 [Solirubrobacteraceae bacterium]